MSIGVRRFVSRNVCHDALFAELLAAYQSPAYQAKLEVVARVTSPADLAQLGNRIEALASVPTAITSFAPTPKSFEATIANVFFLGVTPTRSRPRRGHSREPTSEQVDSRNGSSACWRAAPKVRPTSGSLPPSCLKLTGVGAQRRLGTQLHQRLRKVESRSDPETDTNDPVDAQTGYFQIAHLSYPSN